MSMKNQRKILLIDDDIAVTNYFKVFLMQTGVFDATVLNDSRQAESILENETFDVIVLDMDMPNVSGMDILKDVRARGIKTPVIILTGVSDVDLAVKAMKRGAFDYLTKPVDDEKFLEVLESSIEHGELTQSISEMSEETNRADLDFTEAFSSVCQAGDDKTFSPGGKSGVDRSLDLHMGREWYR